MEYLEVSPHLTINYQESPAISLIVGQDDKKRVFYVHELLLVNISDYFRVHLQAAFAKGQQKECRFPHENERAFRLLVEYLNLRSLQLQELSLNRRSLRPQQLHLTREIEPKRELMLRLLDSFPEATGTVSWCTL